MPMAFPPPTTSSTSTPYRSRFGDTTWTKVFVGGLAWETPTEELRRHFETFGDILEAVVIADKTTGRSKGYGFVTFREPEAARRAVENANPVIDGRRANCNIAALARPRTSPRQQGFRARARARAKKGACSSRKWGRPMAGCQLKWGRHGSTLHPMGESHAQALRPFEEASGGHCPQHSSHNGPWPSMPPCKNQIASVCSRYMASYPSEYGYQQAAAVYSPEMGSYYYQQIYGPTRSLINVGSPPYRHYPNVNMGYPMQMQSRAGYPSLGAGQDLRPPFMQYPTAHMDGAPFPPPPPYHYHPFQLQAPPHARIQLNPTLDSRAPREPSTSGASTENQEV